jgi:hypothetical protein
MRVALAILVVAGTAWLGWEFWRLLRQPDPMGAVDLRLRYIEVHHWFAGIPAYSGHEEIPSAYAPASFALLWPLLGWLSFSAARWFWAFTSIGAILAIIAAFVQGSTAATRLERAFIAAIVIGTYPIGAAIGNGQLTIHVMACTLWSVLWLARHPSGVQRHFIVPLVVFSMVKPSSALPFLVVALFLPGGVAPLVVSALAYLGLTFFAAAFQPADLFSLFGGMSAETNHLANFTGTPYYANLNTWLAGFGMHQFLMPVSIAVLLPFAVWVYVHRKIDIWLLLGVTAIVTRMWTYHRWYDDALLLFPMIGLFRLMKTDTSKVLPAVLFWCGVITTLAPGGLYALPGRLPRLYTAWETLLWLTWLAYLARRCAVARLPSLSVTALRYREAFDSQESSI